MQANYFTPYHIHTEYSLLDSCTKHSDCIDLAVRDGARAISFSEHGKPMNWCEKWAASKAAGLKYIHSVEIYLTESLEDRVRDNYHTVLMAKNMDGLLELNRLVSMSCQPDHFYYTNRISFDEFLGISDNIISTSACLASPLNKLPDTHPMYTRLANKYDFLEIQPHVCEDQRNYNRRLYELSKELNKPLIAGTDTHSSSKYKAECRAALLASKHKSYGDEDALDLTWKTYDELTEMFRRQEAIPEADFLEAIENTNQLIEMTDELELDTSIKYPILYGSREADSAKFAEIVEQKFADKVSSGIIPQNQVQSFRAAIDEEMRVFRKLKMDGFMLSESELVSWCRENGKAVGTARGSVGGSRVAYVTDITDLNPETWHTVFSRFTNEDREEIGDIDTDCIDSDRPAIFQYIVSRFGSDKTARVASFGTMQGKGVIDDVGRYLADKWRKEHPGINDSDNPWSLSKIAKIKLEFEANEEKTKAKYKDLFYYYDGLIDTKISQSVHSAGVVVSPITLDDNFGVFDKDGEACLMLDMDNIHDFTGLAKYDFLALKTVQVIQDICNYIGIPYPKTHEIDWNDEAVWDDMIKSPFGIFQFEGAYAYECMKKFKPRSIFDMSLVTACIRPSGASYRDRLLNRVPNHNPSEIIDELLKNNLNYLVYQEDVIAFLQQICGLSGSEADNIRRAIGRKQKDRLDAAMPSILEGYCARSPKPREESETEAKEFLNIIEDASSYMFGYNHSIAYCMLGYFCAYYRHYYPIEFITSFLNNAANDSDISNGTAYAGKIGIKITNPKWGVSRADYAYDKQKNVIAKGLASVKYMSAGLAEELYETARITKACRFMDVLRALENTSIDSRQLDILIKIEFFSEFGNQRELMRINELYSGMFNHGNAKTVDRETVDGTPLGEIVRKYAVGVTKSGKEAKRYTLMDINSILNEVEDAIREAHMEDLSDITKVRNFADAMGYVGYISEKEEDRRKLYIMDIFPVCRKKDNKQFGYSVITKSIGSGKESRFTVFNRIFDLDPIKKGDIIECKSFTRDGQYFTLTAYEKLFG